MSAVFTYGLPIGAIVIGTVAFIMAMRESRRFDRHYGDHDTSTGDLFEHQRAA